MPSQVHRSKQPAWVECPFCSGVVKPKTGMMKCPECGAAFRYVDHPDCMFADTAQMRLPIDGTLCVRCGLIQDAGNRVCAYCGASLCNTLQ